MKDNRVGGPQRSGGRPASSRGKPGPGKGRVPPQVFRQAQELVEKSGIPLKEALHVASGQKQLREVLATLRLRDELSVLERKGLLLPAYAGEVLRGNMDRETALLLTRVRLRKREPDYVACHLEQHAADEKAVTLALVGRRLVTGKVRENRQFDIALSSRDGEDLAINKHDIKFYFDAGRKKHVLKQLAWGPAGAAVVEDHLAKIASRHDIKARAYQAARDEGRVVNWRSVEHDLIRGTVVWLGRYEVVLETSKGDRIVVMRHAVDGLE